jgi:hypothetical protein
MKAREKKRKLRLRMFFVLFFVALLMCGNFS